MLKSLRQARKEAIEARRRSRTNREPLSTGLQGQQIPALPQPLRIRDVHWSNIAGKTPISERVGHLHMLDDEHASVIRCPRVPCEVRILPGFVPHTKERSDVMVHLRSGEGRGALKWVAEVSASPHTPIGSAD